MVYTRSPDYLYCRNGIYYFTRNVPSDLKTRFNKNCVVVSLHTRSEVRAQKAASALCDRRERYFESLRLERFHSQELGLKFGGAPDVPFNSVETNISDGQFFKTYHCFLLLVGSFRKAKKQGIVN